mgnify:CR=1 FL=1
MTTVRLHRQRWRPLAVGPQRRAHQHQRRGQRHHPQQRSSTRLRGIQSLAGVWFRRRVWLKRIVEPLRATRQLLLVLDRLRSVHAARCAMAQPVVSVCPSQLFAVCATYWANLTAPFLAHNTTNSRVQPAGAPPAGVKRSGAHVTGSALAAPRLAGTKAPKTSPGQSAQGGGSGGKGVVGSGPPGVMVPPQLRGRWAGCMGQDTFVGWPLWGA